MSNAESQRQKDAIAKEKAASASKRLRYLLRQSDIFSTHFGVKDTGDGGGSSATTAAKTSSSKRRQAKSEEGDAAKDDDGEASQATFLLKQPPSLQGEMRAYQLAGLNWMINLQEQGVNGVLADEMGLGKTLQSISILTYLLDFKKIRGPHLILVPKSTLSNWMNEFARFSPKLRPVRLHGNKDERAAIIQDVLKPGCKAEEREWDVCLTTYEVCNIEQAALQKFGWRCLIIDEAHRLKNEASVFSQTVRGFQVQHRLLLTGTPLQNNLRELWALLNFLMPDVFADADQFHEFFNLDVEDDNVKEDMISQLHKVLRPFMLRRLKADVEKSLPPKQETILFTGMSPRQREVYKQILMRDIGTVNGGTGTQRTAVLNIVMQLRKCCNHPYLFPGVEDRTLDPLGDHLIKNCGKMVLLDKLLKKLQLLGHRVLIFSQMTRMLDILEDFMRMKGFEYCRIDGDSSYEEREDLIEAYNRPGSDKFCFLLSTRAGGLGVNLQTADTVILYDSDWNPQADLQAQDRCHRIGQTKVVQVYRLVTEDTVEEKVVERAQQKLKLDAMVVQQGRLSEDKKMSKEELLEALRFGADQVFRSKDSAITDEDIDSILQRGEQRTQELNEKLQKAEKGDLLDFKLDGGTGVQQFEGVDYKDKATRELLRLNFIDMGKRERKDLSGAVRKPSAAEQRARGPRLPRELELPATARDWQLVNISRLNAIQDRAVDNYRKLIESSAPIPEDVEELEALLFTPEALREKQALLRQRFPWMKQDMRVFVDACSRHTRARLDLVAAEVGRPLDEVKRYHEAFWSRGSQCMLPAEWERLSKLIERGEKRQEEVLRLTRATAALVCGFEDPWNQLDFRQAPLASRGNYTPEEDRYLLCLAHRYGHGKWAAIRDAMLAMPRLQFDQALRVVEPEMLRRRCEALMRQAEKEVQERAGRGDRRGERAAVVADLPDGKLPDLEESARNVQALTSIVSVLEQIDAALPAADSIEVLQPPPPPPPQPQHHQQQQFQQQHLHHQQQHHHHQQHQQHHQQQQQHHQQQQQQHHMLHPGAMQMHAMVPGHPSGHSSIQIQAQGGMPMQVSPMHPVGMGGAYAGYGGHPNMGQYAPPRPPVLPMPVRPPVHFTQRPNAIPTELLPDLAKIVRSGGNAGVTILVDRFRELHPNYQKAATTLAIKCIGVKESRPRTPDPRKRWHLREEYAGLLQPRGGGGSSAQQEQDGDYDEGYSGDDAAAAAYGNSAAADDESYEDYEGEEQEEPQRYPENGAAAAAAAAASAAAAAAAGHGSTMAAAYAYGDGNHQYSSQYGAQSYNQESEEQEPSLGSKRPRSPRDDAAEAVAAAAGLHKLARAMSSSPPGGDGASSWTQEQQDGGDYRDHGGNEGNAGGGGSAGGDASDDSGGGNGNGSGGAVGPALVAGSVSPFVLFVQENKALVRQEPDMARASKEGLYLRLEEIWASLSNEEKGRYAARAAGTL